MKILVALGPVLGGISRPVTFSADQMRNQNQPEFSRALGRLRILTLVSWWLIVCVFVVLTGRLVYDTQLKCVFSVIELEFSTGLFFC